MMGSWRSVEEVRRLPSRAKAKYFKVPDTPSPCRAFGIRWACGLFCRPGPRGPNPHEREVSPRDSSVPAPAASARGGCATLPFPGEPLPPRRPSAPARRRNGRWHCSLSLPGCPGAGHGRRHARPAPAKRGSASRRRRGTSEPPSDPSSEIGRMCVRVLSLLSVARYWLLAA